MIIGSPTYTHTCDYIWTGVRLRGITIYNPSKGYIWNYKVYLLLLYIEISSYPFDCSSNFNILNNWKGKIWFRIFFLKCLFSLLLPIEVQLLFQLFIMEGLNEFILFNLKLRVSLQIWSLIGYEVVFWKSWRFLKTIFVNQCFFLRLLEKTKKLDIGLRN